VKRRRLRRVSPQPVHSTGPAAPMSASWCPKGRSRAGASKRRQTSLDRRAARLTQTWAGATTGRPEGGPSQHGRKVFRQRQRAPAQRADATNDRIGNDPDAQRRTVVIL
jgi:hypothetical protein